jgi:hypothetical protein
MSDCNQDSPVARIAYPRDKRFRRFLTDKARCYLLATMESVYGGTRTFRVGFSDYLAGLEDYENRLTRGEIQW